MIYFKYLVVLSLVLAVSRVEGILRYSDWGPRIQSLAPLHSICRFRTGASQYSIDKVINGIFVNEPVIKAYATCIFRESRLISETGDWNYELGAYYFTDDVRDEAISNTKYCDEETKTKGITKVEDRLFETLKCYYGLDPDIFIFF